jgi:hypothetical protein
MSSTQWGGMLLDSQQSNMQFRLELRPPAPQIRTLPISNDRYLESFILLQPYVHVVPHFPQLKSLGFSFDWDRELATTDDGYFKWTQWIFLELFRAGLAEQSDVLVNWCPALGTVLANEEIIDGLSERGGHPVERLPLRQWVLKITSCADELEAGLAGLDWCAVPLFSRIYLYFKFIFYCLLLQA